MESVSATFHNGHVELSQPAKWAEGTRLLVTPMSPKIGLSEAEWPKTEEEIADWLEWFEKLEPSAMAAEERSAFEAELRASKEEQKRLLREKWRKEDQS